MKDFVGHQMAESEIASLSPAEQEFARRRLPANAEELLARDAHADAYPSQRFVVISYVHETEYESVDMHGRHIKGVPLLKVRGVCASAEEADALAREIVDRETAFDVEVFPMFEWRPLVYRDVDCTVYTQPKLEEMMRRVRDARVKDVLRETAERYRSNPLGDGVGIP